MNCVDENFHFLRGFGLVNKPQRVVAGFLCCGRRKTTKHYIRWRCLLVAVLIRKLNRNSEVKSVRIEFGEASGHLKYF